MSHEIRFRRRIKQTLNLQSAMDNYMIIVITIPTVGSSMDPTELPFWYAMKTEVWKTLGNLSFGHLSQFNLDP